MEQEYILVKISNETANILHCTAFISNDSYSNFWPIQSRKRERKKQDVLPNSFSFRRFATNTLKV
jgi:hypothetical protein